jgi:integrase
MRRGEIQALKWQQVDFLNRTVTVGASRRNQAKAAWKSAKVAAKVRCRFHDLRHTACTRLLERGTPLPVVAAIFGWSAGTTAKKPAVAV